MSKPQSTTGQNEFGLDKFCDVPHDQGLSLERLSASFSRLLGKSDDPQTAPDTVGVDATSASAHAAGQSDPAPTDDGYPITPRSIVEAVLFVGHPDNEALTSPQIAALMRSVTPAEVDELVRELNATYAVEGCPYYFESVGAGYRMTLRRKYHGLRDKFYGKIKQARLSQVAIDVLAIVAYNQPIARAEVNKLRGNPSGAILTQLVRRQLLRVDRRQDARRTALYSTTHRFLSLFGLESLEDLPRGQELDALD